MVQSVATYTCPHGIYLGECGECLSKVDFLRKLKAAIAIRSGDEFKSSAWSSERWMCALAGEVGELCNFIKKEFRDGNVPKEAIEHEVADILIYLVAFCVYRDIDIEAVTVRKFNMTSEKRGYATKL